MNVFYRVQNRLNLQIRLFGGYFWLSGALKVEFACPGIPRLFSKCILSGSVKASGVLQSIFKKRCLPDLANVTIKRFETMKDKYLSSSRSMSLSDLWLQKLNRKISIIYLTRAIRTFAFGAISVILTLYLVHRGFTHFEVGALISATLIEDAVMTVLVSMLASRFGMRPILLISSLLLMTSGIVLATNESKIIIVVAMIFGIVSPAGFEGGPFGPMEQTLVSQLTLRQKLTKALSIYNLCGFAGAGLGSYLAGWGLSQYSPAEISEAFSRMFFCYAATGLFLYLLYYKFDFSKTNEVPLEAIEAPISQTKSETKKNVFWLASLQAIDAMGGGFIPQTLVAYWFVARYNASAEFVGILFLLTNIMAAGSLLMAPMFARKFGLLKTMVCTHLPCSLILCALPFMPSAMMAAFALFIRSIFSSMDIPVRQSYSMLLVPVNQRPATAAMINTTRSIAQGLAPIVSGGVTTSVATGLFFVFAGVTKVIYDIGLFAKFRHVDPDMTPSSDALASEFSKYSKQYAEADENRPQERIKVGVMF